MIETYAGQLYLRRGAVRFEADLNLAAPSFRCNCSICHRNASPAIVKAADFRLMSGQDLLTEYRFNSKLNQHFFCRVCGIRPFGIGNATRSRGFTA